MLELKNIKAGYRKGEWILDGINLTINKGETLGVIGKNGSGKSTLAKAIMGLVPYREGQIIFNGKDISRLTTPEIAKAGIGYFMQGGEIFPNLSVYDNLIFAGRNHKNRHKIQTRLKQISTYIAFLNENDKLNIKASFLSGGEKHQLSLAMVLMQYPTPDFVILDEPSAGLSLSNVKLLYETLDHIRSAENLTLMIIEQNLPMILIFSNRIIRICNRKIETIDLTKEKEIMMSEFIMN